MYSTKEGKRKQASRSRGERGPRRRESAPGFWTPLLDAERNPRGLPRSAGGERWHGPTRAAAAGLGGTRLGALLSFWLSSKCSVWNIALKN